ARTHTLARVGLPRSGPPIAGLQRVGRKVLRDPVEAARQPVGDALREPLLPPHADLRAAAVETSRPGADKRVSLEAFLRLPRYQIDDAAHDVGPEERRRIPLRDLDLRHVAREIARQIDVAV